MVSINEPGRHTPPRLENHCGSLSACDGSSPSTLLSTVTPLSRAGSLPHWDLVCIVLRYKADLLWERACSRRGRHIQHRWRLTPRLREQARSHI
ncbi:hypothetical protein OU5_2994 [Pseudomonas mandelii JR-1]|uniref:Uncharacterized protein n=1 Tax=Pseudomonas mandelii JR-1 TaxID=1147786 RepID=A0A024ECJ0_9PSED|nr:hypothetical protein OU5_2994 [Pseudomonas mandelii JR-1]